MLESRDRFPQWMRTGPVNQVQIDEVEAETPQAPFARGRHAGPICVLRVDLADNEHVIARNRLGSQRIGERKTNDFLRSAFAVHFCSVNNPVAKIDRGSDRTDLARALAGRLAHAPGPQSDRRDCLRISESRRKHGYRARTPLMITFINDGKRRYCVQC